MEPSTYLAHQLAEKLKSNSSKELYKFYTNAIYTTARLETPSQKQQREKKSQTISEPGYQSPSITVQHA